MTPTLAAAQRFVRVDRTAPWVWVGASVTGSAHLATEAPCQDSHLVRVIVLPDGSHALLAAAADGAGSARYSGDGSRIACMTLLDEVEGALAGGLAIAAIQDDHLHRWVDTCGERVAAAAQSLGLPAREFATTLLGAIVGPHDAAFLQLGDGAIVTSAGGAYAPVFWPQSGEYANTTYFITNASDRADLMVEVRPTVAVDAVALFSDGVQHLALGYTDRTAHAGFFQPMFAQLRAAAPSSDDGAPGDSLGEALAAFLRSDRVRARSDDDLTLVLAALPLLSTDDSASATAEAVPPLAPETQADHTPNIPRRA